MSSSELFFFSRTLSPSSSSCPKSLPHYSRVTDSFVSTTQAPGEEARGPGGMRPKGCHKRRDPLEGLTKEVCARQQRYRQSWWCDLILCIGRCSLQFVISLYLNVGIFHFCPAVCSIYHCLTLMEEGLIHCLRLFSCFLSSSPQT